MRKTLYGFTVALKLFAIAAVLLVIAFTLVSTPVFGDANAIGVALFVGFAFFIPAGVLCVLGLLTLVTQAPHSHKAVNATYLRPDEVAGGCPNCEAVVPLGAAQCPCCGALFGEHSSWQVRRLPDVRRGLHA